MKRFTRTAFIACAAASALGALAGFIPGAKRVLVGGTDIVAAYAGAEKVWPPAPKGFRLLGPYAGQATVAVTELSAPVPASAGFIVRVEARKADGDSTTLTTTRLGMFALAAATGSVASASIAGIVSANGLGQNTNPSRLANGSSSFSYVTLLPNTSWDDREWRVLESSPEGAWVDGTELTASGPVTSPYADTLRFGFGANVADFRYRAAWIRRADTGEMVVDLRADGTGGLVNAVDGSPVHLPAGVTAEPWSE